MFCRQQIQSWDGPWPAALGRIPGLLSQHFDRIAELLDTPDRTVAHGDFHSQNIHVGIDRCTLIDFQFVQHATGMLDLARLLATSLTIEVRRAVEHEPLDAYHSRLAELGAPDESAGRGVDQLRAGLLWNFVTPLALHLSSMRANGTPWPQRLPILERCLAAVEDWGADAVLG